MYLKMINTMAKNIRALPREYTQVKYISARGSSYFDTDTVFNKDMQIEAGLIAVSNGMWGAGISGITAATLSHSGVGVYIASVTPVRVQQGVYVEYIANDVQGRLVTKDGQVLGTFTDIQNFVPSLSCTVFCVHQGGYIIPGTGSISYFKIVRHNGDVLCNYIACVRNSDGVAGMYDLVSHRFKTSMTSTQFDTLPVI